MKHLFTLLLLVATLALAPRAEAFSLSLEPPSQAITVGDTATYTLRVKDSADPIFFTDYAVSILFDSSILSFDSANFIMGTGTADISQLFPDLLLIEGSSLLSDPLAPPFDLASLTFTGISLGTSELIIAVNTFADLTTFEFFEADSVSNAQANVVPEPSTLMLLGAGLAALGAAARRRRN